MAVLLAAEKVFGKQCGIGKGSLNFRGDDVGRTRKPSYWRADPLTKKQQMRPCCLYARDLLVGGETPMASA